MGRQRQIRMSDELWNQIGQIALELGYVKKDKRGAHSRIIREMVAATVAKWRRSPYVCTSADHFILIAGTGDVFCRQVQTLHLNSRREKLPWTLEMKAEKRAYFEDRCPEAVSRDEWIKSRWLLHHFAVWKGKDAVSGKSLCNAVDRDGVTSKFVDMEVGERAGRYLTRELFIGLRDYVQWLEPDQPDSDRAEIPIDIPTRDLTVTVVVDEGVYSQTDVSSIDEIDPPGLEFRNRESARFADNSVARYELEPPAEIQGHSALGDTEAIGKIKDLFSDFATRGLQLSEPGETADDGEDIVLEERRPLVQDSFVLPKRYFYYQCDWPTPHHGLEVCVRWEKPERKT